MRHVLGSLARRGLDLHEEIKIHSGHLKMQARAAASQLVDAVGKRLDIAAEMLITAGDNSTRISSEAAFPKMCGVCPIPAGGRLIDLRNTELATHAEALNSLSKAELIRNRGPRSPDCRQRLPNGRFHPRNQLRHLDRYPEPRFEGADSPEIS